MRPLPPLPDRTGARDALQRCPILPTAQLEYHGKAKRGGDIFIELRMGTFLKSSDTLQRQTWIKQALFYTMGRPDLKEKL